MTKADSNRDIDVNFIRNDFFKSHLKSINKVKKLTFSEFKSININCDNISQSTFDKFYEKIKIEKSKSIIYYFEIISNYDILIIKDSIALYKKNNPANNRANNINYLALSRVNRNVGNILYVGKSVKDTKYRLSCHFGVGDNHFFSLHLNKWVSDLKMKPGLNLKFHYMLVDSKDNELVELFENAFHYYLKPILGRSGH